MNLLVCMSAKRIIFPKGGVQKKGHQLKIDTNNYHNGRARYFHYSCLGAGLGFAAGFPGVQYPTPGHFFISDNTVIESSSENLCCFKNALSLSNRCCFSYLKQWSE